MRRKIFKFSNFYTFLPVGGFVQLQFWAKMKEEQNNWIQHNESSWSAWQRAKPKYLGGEVREFSVLFVSDLMEIRMNMRDKWRGIRYFSLNFKNLKN